MILSLPPAKQLPWSFYRTAVETAGLVRFGVAIAIWTAAWVFSPEWGAPVIFALLTIATVAWIGFELIPTRPKQVPLDDIGFWYILAVASYGALPLIIWLSLGGEWSQLNDLRLFLSQPGPQLVATLGFYYALHLAAFVVAYLLFRGSSRTPPPVRVEGASAGRAFVLWLAATAVAVVVNYLYPFERTSYADSYLAVQQMPLVVRQIMRLAHEVRTVVALVVLAWLFSKPTSRRARWAYVWIAVLLLMTLTQAGERGSLAALILAAIILHHRQIRPKRAFWFVMMFISGLLSFTALGWYRDYRGLDNPASFSFGFSSGEFEAVFATAEDLWTKRWNAEIRGDTDQLFISEVLAPIPSQVLPFEKADYSTWYLKTYYPEVFERGGGLAFGVLAQAAVGWGVLSLILRGITSGIIFGLLRHWYGKRSQSPIVTVAYLWCVLYAYQSVRTGTVFAVNTFVQFVPLALLLVFGGMRVQTTETRAGPYVAPSQPL